MAVAPKIPEPVLATPPADTTTADFADAFKELTAEDDAPKLAEGTDPIVEGAAALEAAKPDPVRIEIEGLPDPKVVGADGKVVTDPAAPKVEAKPTEEPAKLSDAEMLDRFRAIVAEPPKPAPAAAAPAAPAAADPKPAVSRYTETEQRLVDDYIKEWPDVYAAEQLIRAREYQALVNHIFTELAPIIQGLQGQTVQLAVQTHVERLEAAIPDYNEVTPKVLEWIGKQPAYLKAAYEAVAQKGDIPDVVDLVNRYRAETGTAAPAPKLLPATAAAAAPTTTLASKVVKGLAPVAGKRSGVQTDAIQMDDYDGAFGAFSRAS